MWRKDSEAVVAAPLAHGSRRVKVARGAALFVVYLNRLMNFAEPAAKLFVNAVLARTKQGRRPTTAQPHRGAVRHGPVEGLSVAWLTCPSLRE